MVLNCEWLGTLVPLWSLRWVDPFLSRRGMTDTAIRLLAFLVFGLWDFTQVIWVVIWKCTNCRDCLPLDDATCVTVIDLRLWWLYSLQKNVWKPRILVGCCCWRSLVENWLIFWNSALNTWFRLPSFDLKSRSSDYLTSVHLVSHLVSDLQTREVWWKSTQRHSICWSHVWLLFFLDRGVDSAFMGWSCSGSSFYPLASRIVDYLRLVGIGRFVKQEAVLIWEWLLPAVRQTTVIPFSLSELFLPLVLKTLLQLLVQFRQAESTLFWWRRLRATVNLRIQLTLLT